MASSGYGQDEWWLCKLRSGRRGEYAREVLNRGFCVVDGVVEAELVAACGREGCALRESSLDSAQCAGGPLATRARGVELLERGDTAVLTRDRVRIAYGFIYGAKAKPCVS